MNELQGTLLRAVNGSGCSRKKLISNSACKRQAAAEMHGQGYKTGRNETRLDSMLLHLWSAVHPAAA